MFVYSINRNPGRPKIHVPIEEIELLRNLQFSWTHIAKLLDISQSTLYRRLEEEGVSLNTAFSNISDGDLDRVIREIKATHPNDGERLIIGPLEKIRCFLVQEISRTLTELFIYPLNLIYKGNLSYPYIFPTLG